MKNVIITGISRGLGYELYKQLSALRFRLIGIGRTFRDEQADLLKLSWDLSIRGDNTEVGRLLDSSVDVIFINNAGTIEPLGGIGTLPDDFLWNAAMVNFVSPMVIVNYLVGWSRQHDRHLKIINITTGAAIHAIDGWGSYCATKAAMKMFLDVLAEESKTMSSVEVVQVDPGVMDTDMQKEIRGADFPLVQMFRLYKEQNKLRSASDVAREIIAKYVES